MENAKDMRRDAASVVDALRRAGYEAWFVGGCVRDELIGRKPKDYDVATSARPDEMLAAVNGAVDVGAKAFGVVVVPFEDHCVEVATFRTDGEYSDGRRPDSVEFTGIEEDAKRRDFTVNALYMDPWTGDVKDFVGGLADISAGHRTLRFVGDPSERIGEDRLRALRLVRFAAELPDFAVDEASFDAAIAEISERGLAGVAAERVGKELWRMVECGDKDRVFFLMERSGFIDRFMPEVAALRGVAQDPEWHPEGDAYEHTRRAFALAGDPVVAMAALLHDVGKKGTTRELDGRLVSHGHAQIGAMLARDVMARLKLPWKHEVLWLVENHMLPLAMTGMRPGRMKRVMTHPSFPRLLELHRIDKLAGNGNLDTYEELAAAFAEIGSAPPRPIVDGRDLLAAGITGAAIGAGKTAAYETQLEGESDFGTLLRAAIAAAVEYEKEVGK